MIDQAYKTVQGILNKEHFGNLTPDRFNLFAYNALLNIYNDLINRHRRSLSNVKANRGGEDYQNFQETIDFYTTEHALATGGGSYAPLPSDKNYIVAVWYDNGFGPLREVERMGNSELGYVSGLSEPSLTFPMYHLKGNTMRVLPATISTVSVWYVKKPLIPKWTYNNVGNTPVFNPSAADFQDLDMPEDWFDKLVEETVKIASIHLRELQVNQIETNELTQQYQKDTL